MAVDVIMPRVDMTMERGTIRAWKVRSGDSVREGALLFEIETDKSAMEIDAPASGILGPILVHAGVEVPVGTVVARILAAGESAEAAPPRGAPPSPPPVGLAPPPVAAPAASASPTGLVAPPLAGLNPRPRATPLARRLAGEHGLDLASLRGTGPRGRIGRADVEAARAASRVAPPAATSVAIFHASIRADLGVLLELRARIAASRPGTPPPGPTALLLRLLGALLPGHPALLSGTGSGVHVAVALARAEGTRLAVVADLHGRRAECIAAELARLAAPGAAADAAAPRHAMVLANVGRLGIESYAAVPRRGEAPVLALGAIDRDRGTTFTFAADRDALDPAEAMRFLSRLRDFAAAPWLAL
jgi:pyruvate dehydrogenase E2 component (dihydrolipoamide acetyltransferase)